MRVMIAIDGTEAALDAAQVAVDIFGNEADYTVVSIGSLHALQTVTPVIVDPTLMLLASSTEDQPIPDLTATRERQVQTATERMAKDAVEEIHLPNIETVVGTGAPGPMICSLAEDAGTDVIVLGSHERGWLSRLRDPSVARHVVEHAPCHVLVVRGSPQ